MSCVIILMYMHAKKEPRRAQNTFEDVAAALSVNVFLKKTNSKEWKIFSKNSCKFTQCTVMCLLCCVHASFPARLKITQISGTSVSQVDLSVYLSDCLSRHLRARYLFHPLTDEPF